jgi:hypothetical protein
MIEICSHVSEFPVLVTIQRREGQHKYLPLKWTWHTTSFRGMKMNLLHIFITQKYINYFNDKYHTNIGWHDIQCIRIILWIPVNFQKFFCFRNSFPTLFFPSAWFTYRQNWRRSTARLGHCTRTGSINLRFIETSLFVHFLFVSILTICFRTRIWSQAVWVALSPRRTTAKWATILPIWFGDCRHCRTFLKLPWLHNLDMLLREI